MWACPRCSQQYDDASNCVCGYEGAPLETPAVQTIFSSGPAVNEALDQKRRNIGLVILFLDVALVVTVFRFFAPPTPAGVSKLSEAVVNGIIASAASYRIVRRADCGSGLALLVAATTFLVLSVFVSVMVALHF
jgi:hypothetical protein